MVKVLMQDQGLSSGLKKAPEKVHDAIDALLAFYAPQVEADMKSGAPWTDRTGNARNGLAATNFRDGDSHVLVAYHQVPYGIWLEVGGYPVIMPTLDRYSEIIMSSLQNMLERENLT